jgi:hypothetical protein
VPLGNNQNLTALGLYFGHQRRLGLRRPLPAALNHDLAIHSKHSFWTVQKDPASLSTLLSTTAGRPVQTGRLLIARNSSFTYKGQAIDVKQVGQELGVRYLLEGSVRKTSQRVRITAQLIEAWD